MQLEFALERFKKTLNSLLKTKIKEKTSNVNYRFLKIKKEQELRKNPDIIEQLFNSYKNQMDDDEFLKQYPTLENYVDDRINIEITKFINDLTKKKIYQ